MAIKDTKGEAVLDVHVTGVVNNNYCAQTRWSTQGIKVSGHSTYIVEAF